MNSVNHKITSVWKVPIIVLFSVINIIAIFSGIILNGSLVALNYVSIAQIIINAVMLFIIEGNTGFCVLFLCLSFLFHQSHLLLTSFGIDTWMLFNTFSRFSVETTFTASSFVLKSNVFLCLGMIIGARKSNRKQKIERIKDQEHINRKRATVGGWLCIVGFICNFYKFTKIGSLAAGGGYLATFETSINGIILTFSSFFILGFCVWMLYTMESRRKVTLLCILIIVYEMLYMMTGNRYEPVIAIICLVVFYKERYIERITVKTWVLVFIAGYLMMSVITMISSARANLDSINFISIFNGKYGLAMLYAAMGEFGGTIYNVAQSVSEFPEDFSFIQFSKILVTLLHIVPGLASIVPNSENILYYINNFTNHYAMGGSYIGEMYFWAGKAGFILALPLGAAIGYLSTLSTTSSKQYVFLRVAFYVAFLSIIRGYLFNTLRVIVWFGLIAYILMNSNIKSIKIKL